jgi:hypothetical protein
METTPKLVAERFEQLKGGDLFIISFNSISFYALKAVPPDSGSKSLILPLGPSLPPKDNQPRLIPWQAETAISFGKDFILRLSAQPEAWATSEPKLSAFCCALIENELFFRANSDPFPNMYQKCWVRVKDGMLHWDLPNGISAFCVNWEILLPVADCPPMQILQHPLPDQPSQNSTENSP